MSEYLNKIADYITHNYRKHKISHVKIDGQFENELILLVEIKNIIHLIQFEDSGYDVAAYCSVHDLQDYDLNDMFSNSLEDHEFNSAEETFTYNDLNDIENVINEVVFITNVDATVGMVKSFNKLISTLDSVMNKYEDASISVIMKEFLDTYISQHCD